MSIKRISVLSECPGGATALNLTHASDLIKARAYPDGFFYSSMGQLSHEK